MDERHGPLVSCETLFENIEDPAWVVFDCRHQLTEPDWGAKQYSKAHIPGAFRAHVDRDLSGPVGDGRRGRHPLPLAFARFLAVHGVGPDTQVVAYDDAGGAWAARVWWLARHHGHPHVAVLDGGLERWKRLGLPLSSGHERPRRQGAFQGRPGAMPTVDTAGVEAAVEDGSLRLVDARAAERFRGESEPVDPVAGHIPGAVSLPFSGNLGNDGRFLSPDELRVRYEAAGVAVEGSAVYCGSGVTAAQTVLAMEVAGLGTPALYPGSWSEWCRPADGRPVARVGEDGVRRLVA